MKSRKFQSRSVDASSTADIAFLLLIFFLVTTTIVNDQGVLVKLPPYVENQDPEPLPAKNVFSVKINGNNELLVEGEQIEMEELRKSTKDFIMNPDKLEDRPDKPTKAIVSLMNDRNTMYGTYLMVYNELKGAYNELWDEMAQRKYDRNYDQLSADMQRQIRTAIPLVISEAEPTDFK